MIVLVNPRYRISFQPPLGPAYLAAYLKKHGCDDVLIIDTTFEELDERLARIARPSLFGLYIMTPYLSGASWTIRRLKEKFPGVVIVAGGPHPTVQPDDVITRIGVDVCVRGEAEQTFLELVKAIQNAADLSRIRGISYMDPAGSKLVHAPRREPIANLDDLPFPARGLLPMARYLRGGTQKTFSYKNIRATTMIASRGCPFGCTYCKPALDLIFGKGVRYRSVANVAEEISQLICDYSVRGIFFVDDTFTCRKSFTMEFCDEVLSRGFDVQFAINSRVDTVNEQMLAALKKAGVVTIMYGIESGSQTVLDNLKKGITVEQIRDTVTATKNMGINVYGYFMIGSPDESASSLKETFNLVRALPFDEVQFSMAAPYAGTHLHDEAMSAGLVEYPPAMEAGGYFSSVVMKSRHLSAGKIRKFHRRLDLYSKYKSLKNLVLRHPLAIPHLLLNRVFSMQPGRSRRARRQLRL